MTLDVRRAADRFTTETPWLLSQHSFSFGPHYDPANTSHGLLVVSNDDVVVRGGAGFQTHPHRDMEIVTWVLDGELNHRDTLGNAGVIHPGLAQRMSAGTGISHTETNSGERPVRFVQMWVLPDTPGVAPSYEQADVGAVLDGGGLHPVVGGSGAAVTIHQRGATLWVGRLKPGEVVTLPDNVHVHLYVARGAASLDGAGPLAEGDAVRLTAAGPVRLIAADSGAEVLIWETA